MNVEFYTKGLIQKEGIWYAEKQSAVSYPDDGNENCFNIEDNSFWFRHRNNCIAEVIKKYPPKTPFFDIGGGNGYVAKAIEALGIETILVEPGEMGCQNARTRNLPNIICSTLEEAGFAKKTLPAIGAFDVVEHFADDAALLRSFHDYLETDGLLYITVPAYKMLWSDEDTNAGHHNRYTLKMLAGRLKSAGFDMLYGTYIFSVLPLPILLFRTLPGKVGLNILTSQVNKNAYEHKWGKGLMNNVWNWELARIKNNKAIPFGGSCLVVAKKVEGKK